MVDSTTSPNNTTGGIDNITISGNSSGAVTVAGDTFENVTFGGLVADNSVTVSAEGGNDIITVQSLGTFAGDLTINGGDGNDTINIQSLGPSYSHTLTVNGDAGDDTVNLLGVAANAIYSFDGGSTGQTDGDKIKVTSNDDVNLSNSTLKVGTKSIDLSNSFENAQLTGGSNSNTFTISDWSGTAAIDGLAGNDTYKFGTTFGQVTLNSSDPDTDTLDFTQIDTVATPLTVAADKSTITSSNGSQITQSGDKAEEINLTLLSGIKSQINDVLSSLTDLIDSAQSDATALTELTNALPFLGSLTGGGVPNLGDLLKLTQTFKEVQTDVNVVLNGLGATPTLHDVIMALNGMTVPSFFSGGGNHLTFATDYRGSATDGHLETLIDIDMHGSAGDSVDLEAGADAATAGISLSASVTANATLSGTLSVGFTTDSNSPVVFLAPERTLDLHVDASASLGSAKLSLGVLGLGLKNGSLDFNGDVHLTLKDPSDSDQRITVTELGGQPGDLFDVSTSVTGTPGGSLTVTVDTGVSSGGTDLHDLTGGDSGFTVNVTLPGLGGDQIFGTTTGAASPHFDFSAAGISLDNFKHVSPTDLLGMLGQVLDSMNGLATSSVLKTPIPFTGKTLGDVVDIASGFKAEILDPLFKSGDILNPDFNGDGNVDFSDLNFSDIQSLAQTIAAHLSLGSLPVDFDTGTQELSFDLNYDHAISASGLSLDFGASLGDIASVKTTGTASLSADLTTDLTFGINLDTMLYGSKIEITPPVFQPDNMAGVTVETVTEGTDHLNEVRLIHVNNATSGTYKLSYDINDDGTPAGDTLTGDIALGADVNAGATALYNALTSSPLNLSIKSVTGDIVGNDRTYTVTFADSVTHSSLHALSGDATNLEGPGQNGRLSADASIGDIKVFYNPSISLQTMTQGQPANISVATTKQGQSPSISVATTRVGQSSSILVATSQDGDATHNEQQTVTVTANGGSFTLSFDGQTTGDLHYGASDTEVRAALNGLSTIGGANGSVGVLKSGDTYTINFGGTAFQHTLVLHRSAAVRYDSRARQSVCGDAHRRSVGGRRYKPHHR